MRGAIANGEKIAALRKTAGLTQDELAAGCGCDVKTIRSAERGNRLDLATLRRIAARLSVEYRDIVADIASGRREANIAAAMAFLRAFDARDPDAVAACFCEDGAVLVFADERLPGAGEYRGRNRVRQWAVNCFAAYLAPPVEFGNYRFEAAGELVFARH
ncbi:MAG TPA: helix-turn-helix transcriptional regulator, partial [Pirellulaceae bacterium]|nr:helix-turn-helix transcriptional regulator [Pirellulaceae bacterium]